MRSLSQAIRINFEVVATEHTHQISYILHIYLSLLNSFELLAVKVLRLLNFSLQVQNSLKKR